MVFSSITFLFIFLPFTLLFYYANSNITYKNVILLFASLLFYAWGEPVYVILMIISILFNYYVGKDIGQNRKKSTLIFGVVVNLLILGYFKYAGFIVNSINDITGLSIRIREVSLPIGISFYTFQAMSYVVDVYRGNCKAQEKVLPFAVYITMFPQLIAGPIVKYVDIEKQLASRTVTRKAFNNGVFLFTRGLAKKVILANCLGRLHETVLGMEEMSALSAWVGAIAYTIQIFNDFSGYSDMAIGLGKIFGFTFPDNFDCPYRATSITDFWRRWHISLSTWFKEYVYIPLGGNRKGTFRQIINLLIVWSLTGLWHGAAWNFVAWGLYYGILLILEKFVFAKVQKVVPAVFRWIFTFFLVIIGWVFFFSSSITSAVSYIQAMFGIGTVGADSQGLFYLASYAVLIIIGLITASNKSKWYKKSHAAFKWIISIVLFVISVAFLISESYNPFLYFRF